MNLDYKCVPSHSEALTPDGWKEVQTLKVGEELLTFNAAENKFEWNQILQLHFYQNAQIKRVFNSEFEVYCTPNHTWLTGSGLKELNQLTSADVLKQSINADVSCLAEFESRSWKHKKLVTQLASNKQLAFSSLTTEDYINLDVWCPTTQNQNWVMRQLKTITITGNSR